MRSGRAFLVIAALFAVPVASAEEPAVQAPATTTPAAPAEKMGREMNGHLFLPSHLIDDPFSYTAFGVALGMGSGTALGPVINNTPPIIDPVLQREYGYTGLGIGVAMNVRILEYLSARAVLGTIAYLGSGDGAAFVIGTSARISGNVGVKGSLPVGENFRFAASLDATYGPVLGVLVSQGIQDVIKSCQPPVSNCKLDPSQFLQQSKTITWIGGLSGAWAPLPYLGVTMNAQFIAPTKTDEGAASVSQTGYTVAVMADFDAKPLLAWLPVGVNLAYSLTGPVGGVGVTRTAEYGFGIYYTGRPHLALGVELDWRDGRLESQNVSSSMLAWLNFRYYWN
jgi:hypothetical protein